ncbi:hypothetical protein ACFQ0G_50625 [Streptomyces chiangmaiensis]
MHVYANEFHPLGGVAAEIFRFGVEWLERALNGARDTPGADRLRVPEDGAAVAFRAALWSDAPTEPARRPMGNRLDRITGSASTSPDRHRVRALTPEGRSRCIQGMPGAPHARTHSRAPLRVILMPKIA